MSSIKISKNRIGVEIGGGGFLREMQLPSLLSELIANM
jgi:hypothetical protein